MSNWRDDAEPVTSSWRDDAEPVVAKKYQFLKPKMGDIPSAQGPLEAGLRVAGSGAAFGLDAPVRAMLSDKPYRESRQETDATDAQARAQAGGFALPLAVGGGLVTALATPAGRLLAPISSGARAPARGVISLLTRALGGAAEASAVSAGIGAVRGAGTDKGAGEGATEGALSPWNLLGALGGAASWLGARARPASQEAAANYLRLNPEEVGRVYGGPGVPVEEAMRRAGQRAVDLKALEPGMEMGQRAVGLEAGNKAATAALDNTVQELNVRGATLDRTALLLDIKAAILKRFDVPGAAEFSKEMRAVAEEVLQKIANDPDLKSGAPLGNFVNAKRFLQTTFERHKTPTGGAFNEMLTRAEQDAARVVREHTEAAALKADPQVHGPEFVHLNRQLHENIPLEEGAKGETIRRLTGRPPGEPNVAYGPKSLVERSISGNLLRDTAPVRVKLGQEWLDPIYQNTPDNLHQYLVQALRNQE